MYNSDIYKGTVVYWNSTNGKLSETMDYLYFRTKEFVVALYRYRAEVYFHIKYLNNNNKAESHSLLDSALLFLNSSLITRIRFI